MAGFHHSIIEVHSKLQHLYWRLLGIDNDLVWDVTVSMKMTRCAAEETISLQKQNIAFNNNSITLEA